MSNLGVSGGGGGRRSGEKSSFSNTCTRLSQYLKEKGSFGEVGLDMARSFDSKGTPRTMNFLPGVVDSTTGNPPLPDLNFARPPSQLTDRTTTVFPEKPEPQVAAQMTIFYGGKVFVFDNFPDNKAKQLVDMVNARKLAGPGSLLDRSNCPPPRNAVPASTSGNNPIPVTNSTPVSAPQVCHQRPSQLPIASDLPIARRVSLNRFLEKRKGRITSKAPYQVEGSPDIASPSASGAKSGKCEDKGKSEAGTSEKLPIGKPDTAATTPCFNSPKENQSWLGLAMPSSSNGSEFGRRRDDN